MAKSGTVVNVRTPRPKTKAQLEQAEKNKRAAEDRLYHHQQKQKRVAELRKLGFSGRTDIEVLAKYEDHLRVEAAKAKEAAVENAAAEYVDFIFNKTGATGKLIERFVAGRVNRAKVHVKQLIQDFLARPRNREYYEIVSLAFAHAEDMKRQNSKLAEAA